MPTPNELEIDIRPADEHWRERYGEDAMSVRIKEDGHWGSLILSESNARILKAAQALYMAVAAEYDMLTPANEADELARHALELAEGKPRAKRAATLDAAPTPTQQVLRGERDWPEDFAHENGNYECICCECGQRFIGHKRRVVCKKCVAAALSAPEGK